MRASILASASARSSGSATACGTGVPSAAFSSAASPSAADSLAAGMASSPGAAGDGMATPSNAAATSSCSVSPVGCSGEEAGVGTFAEASDPAAEEESEAEAEEEDVEGEEEEEEDASSGAPPCAGTVGSASAARSFRAFPNLFRRREKMPMCRYPSEELKPVEPWPGRTRKVSGPLGAAR